MSAYAKTEPSGIVAELQRKVDDGMVSLAYQTTNGYLDSLLRELKVAPSSQLLVASKTSPNKDLISPSGLRKMKEELARVCNGGMAEDLPLSAVRSHQP